MGLGKDGDLVILNTGLRTDIVAHYSDWLFRRFLEGRVMTRNPVFPHHIIEYTISPKSIDAVVFCSKDYAPVLGRLHEITNSYRTYFFYTITPYGKDVEPNVPSVEESISSLIDLSHIVGKRRLVWRYDPILITERYTMQFHFDAFAEMAERISPHVEGCIFNFVENFIDLHARMPELIPFTKETRRETAAGISKIAQKYRLPLRNCCSTEDYTDLGISREACLTLANLGLANACSFRTIKHRGMRMDCHCIESRDIGWYDTCLSGCKYCNAAKGVEDAQENFSRHDPASPLLIGWPEKNDTLFKGVQTSYLNNDGSQISLFE